LKAAGSLFTQLIAASAGASTLLTQAIAAGHIIYFGDIEAVRVALSFRKRHILNPESGLI
jgi:hypothetical protein